MFNNGRIAVIRNIVRAALLSSALRTVGVGGALAEDTIVWWDFLGGGERHQIALLIFDLRVGAGLFLLKQPFELGVLKRRISGVVSAEAGECLMLRKHDGARVAAPLDDSTEECGNGYAALCIDRVQRAALKQML